MICICNPFPHSAAATNNYSFVYLQFSLELNNQFLFLIELFLKAFNLGLGIGELLLQVVHLVGGAKLTRGRLLSGSSCSHVGLMQVHLNADRVKNKARKESCCLFCQRQIKNEMDWTSSESC